MKNIKTKEKRVKYLVTSNKVSSMNSSRCWMNIGIRKLEKAALANEDYYFVCNIAGRKTSYSFKSSELKERFIASSVPIISSGTARYSFYIDYNSGTLFSTISQRNTSPILSLNKVDEVIAVRNNVEIEGEPAHLEGLGFKRKKYEQLTNREKEICNIYRLAALLSEYGFECVTVKNDANGPDIIAYNNGSNAQNQRTLCIQVKGRATIKRNYVGRGLYIAFPTEEGWYLIPHDEELLKRVPEDWLKSISWKEGGSYHSKCLKDDIKEKLKSFFIPYETNLS